ncbi:hypothetical protein [Streptomyces sp. PvR034]|uniref:hypothetical protein n=1 Tax=Streptomyces sp. PvR034 TaxID=3156401 RepID=UPI003390FBDB
MATGTQAVQNCGQQLVEIDRSQMQIQCPGVQARFGIVGSKPAVDVEDGDETANRTVVPALSLLVRCLSDAAHA